MRILLFITGLGMGGAERVVASLADALTLKGHAVLIVYMTGFAVVLPKESAVRVIKLGIEDKTDIVRAFFKFRQIIHDFRPDVVHSHLVHANIFARLATIGAPIKRLISTAHSTNVGGKLRIFAYRWTQTFSDLSTNVSAEAVDAYINAKAASRERMIVMHNGLSSDEFKYNSAARYHLRQELKIDHGCRLLLAVGRLHEAKDYKNLLIALSELAETDVAWKMLIVGEGHERDGLVQLGAQLGISDIVIFLGQRTDVASLMSAADVFVLSSAYEGFGMVVAEAMACERVVVATDCGGVREVLGETGYLVKPRDSKALAQALQAALQLPAAESARIGRAARQRVKDKYSLDAAVEKWLKIYAGGYG